MDNTSGHGQFAVVPDEVKRWNWGAFWLTWIWGLFNGAYISLLALIPILNIIMMFYMGSNGNELAWRSRYWDDAADLHKTQKKWAIAGWIVTLLILSGIVGTGIQDYNEAKLSHLLANEAVSILMNDDRAGEFIGEDFSIKLNMGRSGFTAYGGTQYMSHSFILESEKGMFYIVSSLKNDKEITKVEIDKFGNNTKEERITINVNSN